MLMAASAFDDVSSPGTVTDSAEIFENIWAAGGSRLAAEDDDIGGGSGGGTGDGANESCSQSFLSRKSRSISDISSGGLKPVMVSLHSPVRGSRIQMCGNIGSVTL